MGMKLRIELFPRDMDRFFDFYTRVLRFSVDRDERDLPISYVAIHRDEVRIAALRSWSSASPEQRHPPVGIEIVLEVDDLEAEREVIVSHGWALEDDLALQPWGLWDFRVLDADGYYLRFTTR